MLEGEIMTVLGEGLFLFQLPMSRVQGRGTLGLALETDHAAGSPCFNKEDGMEWA